MHSRALEEFRASLTRPKSPRADVKFRDLAWGALVYANFTKDSQGERIYDSLVSDKTFLKRLQENPSLHDFEKLRDFLVHFGVHQAPKTLPQQHLRLWPQLKPHVKLLRNEILEMCDLSDSKMQNAIKSAFGYLQWPNTWGGDTVASKVLHFFNVRLFVIWDSNIQSAYRKPFGPEGYLEFLSEMQIKAREAVKDFKQLLLPGSPESFLSQRLGYPTTRPLTKFVDEYNWISITKGWPSGLPDWLLDLYTQKTEG